MTEQELNDLLSTASAITALVGTRVYRGYLPEKEPLPCVTFEYVNDETINDLAGDTGHAHNRYSINAWASSYASACALRDAIKTVMAAYPRLSTIPLDEPENRLYRYAIDYSIFD